MPQGRSSLRPTNGLYLYVYGNFKSCGISVVNSLKGALIICVNFKSSWMGIMLNLRALI